MSELFDDPGGYDRMLDNGIKLSGEDKHFFIRGRVNHLRRHLGRDTPTRILDFGCGVGDASAVLANQFVGASVVGVDVAAPAVEAAQRRIGSDDIAFGTLDMLEEAKPFDLCYVNGAFHHIPVDERAAVMARLYQVLRPGGTLAVFENSPWSVPARIVMRRIEFDADAVMLPAGEVARLARQAGFAEVKSTRYLFVFPRALGPLRRIERAISGIPLGAQYAVIAIR